MGKVTNNNALNVLKSVCEENEGKCNKCMLRNSDNDCAVIVNSRGDTYNKLYDWELKNFDNPRVILN